MTSINNDKLFWGRLDWEQMKALLRHHNEEYHSILKSEESQPALNFSQLKCYITSGGNFKLYQDIRCNLIHKEHSLKELKYKVDNNIKEYQVWLNNISDEKYISLHQDEFNLEVKHTYYNHNEIQNQLCSPIKIKI